MRRPLRLPAIGFGRTVIGRKSVKPCSDLSRPPRARVLRETPTRANVDFSANGVGRHANAPWTRVSAQGAVCPWRRAMIAQVLPGSGKMTTVEDVYKEKTHDIGR